MKRIVYGSLSVLAAVSTVFLAAKAEIFERESDVSEAGEVTTAETSDLFTSSLPDSVNTGEQPAIDLDSEDLATEQLLAQTGRASSQSDQLGTSPQGSRLAGTALPQKGVGRQPDAEVASLSPALVRRADQPANETLSVVQTLRTAQTPAEAPAPTPTAPAADEDAGTGTPPSTVTPTVKPIESSPLGEEPAVIPGADNVNPAYPPAEEPVPPASGFPNEPTPTREPDLDEDPSLDEDSSLEEDRDVETEGFESPDSFESPPVESTPFPSAPSPSPAPVPGGPLEPLPPVEEDGLTDEFPESETDEFSEPETDEFPESETDEFPESETDEFPEPETDPNSLNESPTDEDRLVGEGFTPFQLSYLAIAGGLKAEGIPGGSLLIKAYDAGEIVAEDVVAAAAATKRLGTAADDRDDYTQSVDRFLHRLQRDAQSSS